MRNLKRALSLALASVMLMGMMVVGTSAASFPDVDDEDNIEAIDVLETVQVMIGDEGTGEFRPDDPVNRAEMAVVMAKLLNLDYNYYVTSCPFTDVSGNYEWAKGWVGACAANGIVSGRGEGIFDPGATVTAVEAASMMMRALGYFQNPGDYEKNGGFETATVKQASQISLFSGINGNARDPMNRNQVAKLALNALESNMVYFSGDTGFDFNGVNVGYRSEYTYRTGTEAKYRAISGLGDATVLNGTQLAQGQHYVQLGEQLYDGDLKLNDKAYDSFGRPSRKWEYKGEVIGTYIKKDLIKEEYTDEVTGKMLYDLLGSDVVNNKDWAINVTIDGVDIGGKTGTTNHNDVLKSTGAGKANSYFDETYMARTYKSGVGQTGKGVLTQVFVNHNDKIVDVAVINTYLAKANNDYSTKKDEVTLKVYALTHEGSNNNEVFYKYPEACKAAGETNQYENVKITSDDFDIQDIKKDDIFLVTEANGVIETMAEPEVLSAATLTAFSQNKYVVTEGEQYDYNTTVEYDCETLDRYTSITGAQQLKDVQYDVYLDPYGYLIGVKVVDAVNNYIFLTGIDLGTSNLKNKTASAAGILTDGTFVEFTMDLGDSAAWYNHGGNSLAGTSTKAGEFKAGPLWNTWCTYTVDKDGIYTLTEVKHEAERLADTKAKAGQYHDSYAYDPSVSADPAAKDAKGKTINDKNVSLKGAVNGTESAASNKFVYGNDKTIYIVPELKKVASDTDFNANTVRMPSDGSNKMNQQVSRTTDYVGIISGVDSVATGIANVDLITWNADDIDKEIDPESNPTPQAFLKAYSGGTYTLYDNDGYIIAAIVVGEDNGTSKSLVYSHKDSLSKEEYSSANDEWTWERLVIADGKETTLTEIGSKLADSGLKDMNENVWYQITYKADGTVKKVVPAYYTEYGKNIGKAPAAANAALDLTVGPRATAGEFVDNIEYLEFAINNNNKTTTLYEETWGKGSDFGYNNGATGVDPVNKHLEKAPSLVASTLYVDTQNSKGFYVHDDVKTVLIQKNDGESKTTYWDGKSDLASVLDDLNKLTTGEYLFKISAIMTNGRASVVIIHDWAETGATPNTPSTPSDNLPDGVFVDTSDRNDVVIFLESGAAPLSLDEQLKAVTTQIKNEGYTTIDGPTLDGTNFVWLAKKSGENYNTKFVYQNDSDSVVANAVNFTLNGNPALAAPNTNTKDLVGVTNAGSTKRFTGYKASSATPAFTFVASDTGVVITEDMVVMTDYVQVSKTSTGTAVGATDLKMDNIVTGADSKTYAKATDSPVKLDAQNGTGVKINTNTYAAYDKNFGYLAANDGTDDGEAIITGFNQIKVTEVAAAGTETTVASGHNAQYTVTGTLVGLHYKYQQGTDAAAFRAYATDSAQTPALTKDTKIWNGYVVLNKTITAGTHSSTATSVLAANLGTPTFDFTDKATLDKDASGNYYVKVGDTVKVTITFSDITGDSQAVAAGSGLVANITGTAAGLTAVNDLLVAAGGTTLANGTKTVQFAVAGTITTDITVTVTLADHS